jgi:anti-sigma factor (TIGR02949 family)
MTDVGCAKTLAELEEYLHNELGPEAAADIAEHLSGCEDCTDHYRVGLVLTEAIKRAGVESAPEGLYDEVLLRLRAIELSA